MKSILAVSVVSGVGVAQDTPERIAFSVQDDRGNGIGDAVVQVLRPPPAGAVEPWARILIRTRTTDDGTTAAPLPNVPRMTLVVDHPLRERFVGNYDSGQLPSVIRLGPGQFVPGNVLSPDGDPVAGVSVCVRWQDEASSPPADVVRRCGESSEDGSFTVSGLSAFSEAEVTAEAEGHGAATMSPWNAEQGHSPVVVPIPDKSAGTDVLQIRFQAENHLLSEPYSLYPAPGRVMDLGVVYLEPGAMVSGRLFDAVGSRPVAGCLLELVPAGSAQILQGLQGGQHLAISDGAGAFLLGGLVEGRYHLRTECGTGPLTDRLVVLDAHEPLDLGEIWMPAARAIRVRIHKTSKGTVHVMDRFREIRTPLATAILRPATDSSASNGDGAAAFADLELAPGRYRLDLLGTSSGLLVSKEIRVESTATADRAAVDLRYRGRTIRSVLTLDGRRVSGGSVRFERIPGSRAGAGAIQIDARRGNLSNTTMFRPGSGSIHQAQVATDGSILAEDVPDEYLWMTWFEDDGQSHAGRIWPDRPLPQLDLGGVSVVGEVRLASGQTVNRASVVLTGDLDLNVAATYTDDNGRFALPPAPPGRYRISALVGSNRVSWGIDLTADEPPPPLVLETDTDGVGSVEVRLGTFSGPLVGAWLHVLGPDDQVAASRLALEGSFVANDVPAGDVDVLWNHGGVCVGADKVTLEPGQTAHVDRTLHLGRLIELQCRDERCAGTPLGLINLTTEAGVKVSHHLPGALPGTTFSDDGYLGLGCLTPGDFRLSFWTGEQRWDAKFELDPGPEEVPVTVTIRPSPD